MISTISDLDLGSLQRILSYLRYVDKLKMLLVTKCIVKFAEEIFDSEPFDILHVQIHFSVEELKQLLIDYGRYVKRLRYTEWFSDKTTLAYARLLRQHCTNLQEIHFSDLEITYTDIYGQILSSAQKTIKKLTLEECTVSEQSCSVIANMSQLKVLNLPRSELSGKDFGRLKNLTELNLRECKNFLDENFIDILESNKLVKLNLGRFSTSGNVEDIILKTQTNLKVLTVSKSRSQTMKIKLCRMKTLREISIYMWLSMYLEELVSNRVPIEGLEIRESYIDPEMELGVIDRIIQLDNLRVLSIRDKVFFKNQHLVKIAKFCRSIEMLELCRTAVNEKGIIECLEYLKELRHLDVTYCDVEKSFYSRLVEIRNKLGFVQKLVVYTKPQEDLAAVLKSDEYADTKAFVQLTLSPMRTIRDSSMLERLEQLDLSYCNENLGVIRKAARSTKPHSSQVPSLLALDDNSLYHIMQYLPLVDQLKLTLCNSRFDNIIKYFLYTNPFDAMKFVKSFTVSDTKTLLSRCGHMVKKLYIGRDFDAENYDLVSKYVTNVVKLYSVNLNLSRKVISNSLNSLEAIHMMYCYIDDEIAMEISKAARLHTLNFRSSSLSGGGVHFGNLTNLTSLNLWCVESLEPASFIAICQSNKLKDLNIIGCENLNNQSFQVLVETQTNLKILAIGEYYAATNVYIVTQLKKLKDLELRELDRKELMLQCTDALAEFKCDHLEYLHIYYEYKFDATERLKIAGNIAALQNLKYLRINLQINHDFIKTIAKGCRLLRALVLYVKQDVALEAIRLFKHLRHFIIPGSLSVLFDSIYRTALEIKKESDIGPLVLYCSYSSDFILEMEKIREYIINKKYVELSRKCLRELNKYELVKEKIQHCQDKAELRQSNMKEVASSKMSIIDIPGSCLQRIASYLQPIDRLVFAYLHKAICISIGMALDNLLHNLNDIARIFTLSEARDLFAACAGHIKRIKFSTIGNTLLIDYINLLQPYCSYLIEIDITWYGGELCDELVTLFGAKDLKLQKLTVKESNSVNSILEYFASTPSVGSIYSLDVSASSESRFDGKYIDTFKHLTDLNLMNCSRIKNEYFQSICHNCKLKRLNIIGARFLSESSYEVLVKTQNDYLEKLSMDCVYAASNYTKVLKLKNLRHITIEVGFALPCFKIFFKMLVLCRRNDLEYLEIITPRSDIEIYIYDMVENMKSYFRNLNDIAIKTR